MFFCYLLFATPFDPRFAPLHEEPRNLPNHILAQTVLGALGQHQSDELVERIVVVHQRNPQIFLDFPVFNCFIAFVFVGAQALRVLPICF